MSSTTTTSSSKSILAVGLLQYSDNHPEKGGPSAAQIQKMADDEVVRAKSAGYDLTITGIDPDDTATFEEFRGLLKSKPWAGVSIGFGVRGRAEFTPAFEQLVNMVVREVEPAPPKMMFALMPNQIVEAIERAFGTE